MPLIAAVLATLAALIHVWFFTLESLLVERPAVFPPVRAPLGGGRRARPADSSSLPASSAGSG